MAHISAQKLDTKIPRYLGFIRLSNRHASVLSETWVTETDSLLPVYEREDVDRVSGPARLLDLIEGRMLDLRN